MRHLVAMLLALVACSAGTTVAPRDCTPGATSACACPGASGVQTCSAEGRLGACVCGDAGGQVDVPADAPASPVDAPPALDVPTDGALPALDVVTPQDRPQATDAGADAPDAADAPGDVADAGRPFVCGPSQILCSNRCIDPRYDPANCGACGTACPAGQVCEQGVCGISCPVGRVVCGTACADLNTDPANCGACGTRCPSRNSTPFCRGRACGQDCMQGFADCDGNRDNGCETPTATNRGNCGGCGITCGNTEQCVAGACVPGCVGGCGGAAICSAGECRPCGGGRVVCGGACRDLLTDRANCGACGAACPQPAGATVACVNGGCVLTACADPTYRDCDGNAANGCEANVQSGRTNCGACGVSCGSRQTCTAGRCVCQVNTDSLCGGACYPISDPLNCGLCGRACSERQTCSAGSCTECQPDTMTSTWRRCENRCVDIQDDESNCGACGAACGAGRLCFFGVCR